MCLLVQLHDTQAQQFHRRAHGRDATAQACIQQGFSHFLHASVCVEKHLLICACYCMRANVRSMPVVEAEQANL